VSTDETPAARVGKRLTPLHSLPADRPLLPAEPCAACGADVDPLRAPCVLAFEDGVRLLCSEACTQSYRQGVRSRRRPTTGAARTPAGGMPKQKLPATLEPMPLAAEPLSPEQARWLWAGGSAVGLAMLLSLFNAREAVLVSAVMTSLGALCALRLSAGSRSDVGMLGWTLGPLGAAGAAWAARWAFVHSEGGALGVFGAALAAAAMLSRAFFDAEARRPVEQAVAALLSRLPSHVHVPAKLTNDALATAVERIDAGKVRTGEDIIAMKGHVIAVDGVVQAGEADLLPYPGATTTIRRRIGDPILAGATVVEGAVRVLTTRVGEDRALVRVARFGRPSERDAAPLPRLTADLARWGGLAVLGLALGVTAVASHRGLSGPLSAACAVLIAAPLLALRRAAEWPSVAAAATAGARGIVFQSGAALDLAGHATMVAMSPHRTLTEGKPEVVEVHFLGDGDGHELLAVVAAAEQAAGEHPIARAIVAFAALKGVPPIDVRRAVSVAGRGVTAIAPGGEEVVIGSRRLQLDHGVSIATADADAARAEAAGRTAIFVSVAGRVRAVLTLQDHLRVGARAAIQRMFDMDLEVVLLTGDQRGPIEELAAGLDIAHVKAELLPEERGHEVRSLREAGGRVAVIGYPVEDDAALSAADVGIALGAAGGPAGEKAVALVSEDVRDAAAALWIAHAAREGSLRAVGLAATAFAAVVAAAATGLIDPGVAAVLTVAVDGYAVRAGARLLHRIALRLPAWT
jgi:P-type E1-E2 ATPase